MNVVICEDDSCNRDALRDTINGWTALHQRQDMVLVRCFASSEDLLAAWRSGLAIDLAFLDIQIPGEMSGLEFAKTIRLTNEQTSIVFITNYSEYAYDGYSVNALRYLQKPVGEERVYECLDIAYRQWELAKEQFIYIGQKKQKLVFPFRNILYIEAAVHNLQIYCIDKEPISIRSHIKEFMERLAKEGFVLCHRSYIVNLLYARSITKNAITLVGDHHIPIGLKYRENVLERFKQYYQGAML